MLVALATFLYLAPTMYAMLSHRENAGPIFVLNFLLGWTFVGWIVAAAWATEDY